MAKEKFIRDWTLREPNDVWVATAEGEMIASQEDFIGNADENFYYLVYELSPENNIREETEGQIKEGGFKKLLEVQGLIARDTPVATAKLEQIIKDDVKVVEFFVDPRPNVHQRVLIAISVENYFTLTSSNLTIAAANTEKDVELFSNFNTLKLENQIKNCASLLRQYAVDIKKYDGTIVPPLNFDKDAEKLESVLPKIISFLKLNSLVYRSDEEDSLQVGFDLDFNLTFLRFVQDGKSYTPQEGFNKLKKSTPIDSTRIMHYFWFSGEMSTIKKEQLPWTEFVNTFVFPTPDIFPSVPKNNTAVDPTGNEQPNIEDKTSVKDSFPEIDIINLDSDSCEVFKSFVDKISEDNLLKSYEFQTTWHNDLLSSPDFNFNPDFSVFTKDNINDLIKKLGSLEAVFKLFLNKMDINDIIKQVMDCLGVADLKIDIGCFGDPSFTVPTIPFPDFIPTVDIMSDLTSGIKVSIETLLVDTFVQTIIELLSQLALEFECQEFTAEFGSLNILDDLVKANTNPRKITENVEVAVRQNGLDAGPIPFDDLSNALGDISLMFTPPEICLLMSGNSNDRNLHLVQSLIKTKHPNLLPLFSSKTTTSDVMQSLGRLSSLNVCGDFLTNPDISTSPNALCDDPLEDLKCKLMMNKGATAKECEEQLEAERARRDRQAAQLTDLLQNGLTEDIPPVFCTTDENGNVVPGLVNTEHESVKLAIDSALDAVFDPVYTSFDTDANQWALTMESINNVEEQVPILIPQRELDGQLASPENLIINPDIQRLIGQGVPESAFIEPNSKPLVLADLDRDNKFPIPRTTKTAPLYLENNLLDPTNKRLSSVSEAYLFDLDVPQDPTNTETLTLLDTVFAQIDPTTLTDEQKQQIKDRIASDTFNYSVSLTFPTLTAEAAIQQTADGSAPRIGTLGEILGTPRRDPLGSVHNYKDQSFLTVARTPEGSTEEEIFLAVPMKEELEPEVQEVLSTLPLVIGNQNYSYQQIAFSEYMRQQIEQIPDLQDIPELLELLKKEIYTDISSDLVLYISRLVAESIYFDNKEPSYNNPDGSNISTGTPFLEDVVLNPPKTANEESCGVDNSLLSIGEAKDNTAAGYEDNKCGDNDLIEDGQRKPNTPNAVEGALSEQAILMLCRLAIIDYYLRGIFALSTIRIEDEKYNLLSAYIARKTVEDVKAASPNLFIKFATTIYDMFLEATLPSEEDVEQQKPLVVSDQQTIEALTYFILQQMPATVERLSDFLNIGSDLMEVNNSFITKYTPDIWAAENFIGKTRFENIDSTETLVSEISQLKQLQGVLVNSSMMLNNEKQAGASGSRLIQIEREISDIINLGKFIREKLNKLEERPFDPNFVEGEIIFKSTIFDKTISYNGNQFDLTEGNLFLEKYIAITDKSQIDQSLFQAPGDVFYAAPDFVSRKTPQGNEYPGLKASERGKEVIVNPELLSNFLSELAARFGNLTLLD
ncbi:MAG: hypothetical protein CMB97_08155, partial [Flavobacteriaceae bacterium]|nr:hypothetical protein [Flavobacteriaceae bacterium]